MSSYLSIWGLYDWDRTVFDDMVLPDGVDKNLVVSNILLECEGMEILYPNPDLLKQAIKIWSLMELPVWTRLYETTQYEYDPIENYDRKEDWEDTNTGSDIETRNLQTTDNRIPNLTRKSDTKNGGSDVTENQVSAFNTSTYSNRDKATLTYGGTNTDTTTETGSDNRTGSDTGTISRENSGGVKHTGRIHGNIGITTTQKMIQEERDISEFNLVKRIVIDFKKRFCIGVY